MHRQAGNVPVQKFDVALVRFHHADDHVERGGLARAVRPEQPDDFAGTHFHRNAVDDAPAAIGLHQVSGVEQRAVGFSEVHCNIFKGEAFVLPPGVW